METIAQLIEAKGGQVWSIQPDEMVYQAIEMMADKHAGALVVVKDEKLVGIISERDYTRKVILQGKASKQTPVIEVMTSSVITAKPDQSINECMALMNKERIRHMPVLSEDKLVGIISMGDLVRIIIERQETTIHDLETYINA